MREARVVDTNVLIVASAADDGSPFQPEATPVQEKALRKQVLDWLEVFEQDAKRHVVLDYDWKICGEYQNKLTEQDYGWLAMMRKKDQNEVVWVGLDMDADGHATLPAKLAPAVTDLADRKMVAAVLAAIENGEACKLTNACDTDWLDCKTALHEAGVQVEHLLEDWLIEKRANKHK
jgi:hypothetical protein